VKPPNRKKLSHRRLAAWIATAAATAVGSGDLLGVIIVEGEKDMMAMTVALPNRRAASVAGVSLKSAPEHHPANEL
jgi:hypothetical protein